MKWYLFWRDWDDGCIKPIVFEDAQALLDHIAEHNEEVHSECQYEFVTDFDEISGSKVLIMHGDIRVPKAVEVVRRYSLDIV